MNLHLMSPIGYTGYGYAGLNILKSLSNDNNIALHLIGNPNVDDQEDMNLIKYSIGLSHLIPLDSPCLKIWHQFDLLNKIGKGTYIAFPFFEVTSFNQKELYNLQLPDKLVVSSDWAKQILINNNVKQSINVVPLGVDTTIFDYTKNQNTNNYVFITIGKWEKRKAHDTIIECFNKAFNHSDEVELWLVTHNGFLNPQEEKYWTDLVNNSPLSNKIRVFPRLPTHQNVAEVISYSNCGIYISRGEGWDMELLETMAMNKPVIASNYSAHTEYCNSDNSFLVDMPDTEAAIDNKWFFGQSNWGKIGDSQIEQTIAHMQYCYNNRILTNENGLKTAQSLSWNNTASKLVSAIE
jgi:glycosyltransferase involved in cell wall biosynthesis